MSISRQSTLIRTFGRLARIALIVALVAGLIASLLLAAWPATPARPLVPKNGWRITGQAFQNVKPGRFELPRSMAESPDAVYWRTWNLTGAKRGTITTTPFVPTRYMAIPYGGFAGKPGIQLDLRCVASGKTMSLATARTNNQMTEATVRMPHGWCAGPVVLRAESHSTEKYIEVGTPFSISTIAYYKNSFAGLVGIYFLVLFFGVCLLLVPDAIRITANAKPGSILAGLATIGLASYIMFFVFFFSATFGRVVSGLILAVPVGLLAWLYVRRSAELEELWRRRRLPLALWALVSLAGFALSMAVYNGAGPWTVNALFTPVRWSSDNQFPMQISEYLFQGIDPRTLSYAPWQVSDRPPLMYGGIATFRLISWLIASRNDGNALFYQYAQITGIVLNSLWVLGLYWLLSVLRVRRAHLLTIIIVVSLTGFVVFNTVYIWPKMLGAAFGLVAFALLFEPDRHLSESRYHPFGSALLAAALFSGLALESHGGTAFGVIAAIMIAVWFRGLPSWRLGILAVMIGLAVLTPWALWQHFAQPPGNALIKYAFSGNFGFNDQNQSIFSTVREAYSKLTLSSWIAMKLHALRIVFTGEGIGCSLAETAPISSLAGELRVQDFFHLFPSLRFLLAGFVPLIFVRRAAKRTNRFDMLHYARIMVGTGLLSVGLYSIFSFHCYINHMQSYQAIVEVIAGLALCLCSIRRWVYALVFGFAIAYGVAVWIGQPIATAPRLDWWAVMVLAAVLGFSVFRCSQTATSSIESTAPADDLTER